MSDAEILNKDNLLQSIYKQKKLKDSLEKKETDEDVNLVIEKERLNSYENTDEVQEFQIVPCQGSLDEVSEKIRKTMIENQDF